MTNDRAGTESVRRLRLETGLGAGPNTDGEQNGQRPVPADRDTQERTRELMRRARYATPEERRRLRDEVVTLHLGLADRAARRYGLPSQREDLVQVARAGLVEAFDRYDVDEATPYSSFAWITVHGLLRRHLRDHGWSVRPPRSSQEGANVLRRTVPALTQELGRVPTTADLVTHLGWTPQDVDDARKAELALQATSLEALVCDAWAAQRGPEWDLVETRVLLQRAVRDLGERERALLRMRFEEELTQAQIAVVLGTTQMQVSRLLSRLMTRLRTRIGELDEPSLSA